MIFARLGGSFGALVPEERWPLDNLYPISYSYMQSENYLDIYMLIRIFIYTDTQTPNKQEHNYGLSSSTATD